MSTCIEVVEKIVVLWPIVSRLILGNWRNNVFDHFNPGPFSSIKTSIEYEKKSNIDFDFLISLVYFFLLIMVVEFFLQATVVDESKVPILLENLKNIFFLNLKANY